jgi:hypothetical protein
MRRRPKIITQKVIPDPRLLPADYRGGKPGGIIVVALHGGCVML